MDVFLTKENELIVKSYGTNLFSLWILMGTSFPDLKYSFLPKILELTNRSERCTPLRNFLKNYLVFSSPKNAKHPLLKSGEIETPREETYATKKFQNNDNNNRRKIFLTFLHKHFAFPNGPNETEDFLLLHNFPCLISSVTTSELLMTRCCSEDRKEVASAALSCLALRLKTTEGEASFGRFLDVLERFSEPESPLYQRLSVCRFLNDVKSLVLVEEPKIPSRLFL